MMVEVVVELVFSWCGGCGKDMEAKVAIAAAVARGSEEMEWRRHGGVAAGGGWPESGRNLAEKVIGYLGQPLSVKIKL
ncbi:hypothetical protein Tco_0871513 [Tanacetum coccineum]